MAPLCYRRHRFPPEIIQHAIWLYLRFTLSYRDVEELLAEPAAISRSSGPAAPRHGERPGRDGLRPFIIPQEAVVPSRHARDPDDHFVEMPAIARSRTAPSQSPSDRRSEFEYPTANAFVGEVEAARQAAPRHRDSSG